MSIHPTLGYTSSKSFHIIVLSCENGDDDVKRQISLPHCYFLQLDGMNPEEIESFAILPLSKKTLKGLRESKFTVPTKVQRQSLLFSLQGLDVVAAAKTGSGKTLAFIIPVSKAF